MPDAPASGSVSATDAARLVERALEGLMLLRVVREEGHVTDFEWTLVNPQAAAMLGRPGEPEWAGRRVLAVFPGLKETAFFENCVHVAQRGAPLRSERYRQQAPLQGWLDVAIVPFDETDGQTNVLAVTLRDVTDRHADIEMLRESARRFRVVTEHISDLVCLHEPDGTCVFASPSARNILGYAPEEIEGRGPLHLTHPDDTERVRATLERTLAGERVVERMRLRHKEGGYRHVETACRPIYDLGEDQPRHGEGPAAHLLTSTRDVTERVQAEEDLERTNAELRLRNRELQDFAHIASHDLQEPLRKVRAFAGLMREDYDEVVDETGRYYLERMEDGAERMSRLVSDLLDLARVTTQGRPFEPVDLGEIAATVRADLEMRIEETGGRVEIGALPRLEADPTQMRQLLQNLIGNALKFHREGVPPVVEVEGACPGDPLPEEQESEETPPRMCRLVVKDNGVGFEEKFLDRIFTPLQRLHGRETFDGTGTGLAVCRRIVGRHRGRIWAESTPGVGSRFWVVLPAAKADADALGEVVRDAPTAPGNPVM